MANSDDSRKTPKPDENVHKGHRMRLKQRFVEHGLDNFNDINALELLLCFAIPRRDTNVIAHRLLDHFGSFKNVCEVSIDRLTDVNGVGESAAILINLVAAMAKRYMLECNSITGSSLDDVNKLGKYMASLFMYEKVEVAIAVCLDNMLRPISVTEIGRGVVNITPISKKRLIDAVVTSNAASVALAHNHIGSVIYPSDEDIAVTKDISNLLKSIGVRLTDHIIVMGSEYYSMRSADVLRSIFR